ncbi:hypothetical protein L596_030454 [Steinernema carpocapsae]|uniref:Uncharacterized protein n=1 Tax=Steinernema carpocapsae TaxID=34508 RepID=A0A4U5LPH8_STECR|nr:hypothetical protein L596_030454 [Steinernema carpocapsae]
MTTMVLFPLFLAFLSCIRADESCERELLGKAIRLSDCLESVVVKNITLKTINVCDKPSIDETCEEKLDTLDSILDRCMNSVCEAENWRTKRSIGRQKICGKMK